MASRSRLRTYLYAGVKPFVFISSADAEVSPLAHQAPGTLSRAQGRTHLLSLVVLQKNKSLQSSTLNSLHMHRIKTGCYLIL